MSFFSRLSNGWNMAMVSFGTIQKRPFLMLFPVLSLLSFIVVLSTFLGGSYFFLGDEIQAIMEDEQYGRVAGFATLFLYYLINFFIVIFFNSALLYCASRILDGEETSVSEGLEFANSRLGKIFAWSVVAATVGMLLKLLQETGKIGQFVSSLLGVTWSILTFFAVPVLIFQDKSVMDTIKESGRLIREKWGESLAANISFGIFHLLGLAVAALVVVLLFNINIFLAILLGILIFAFVSTFIATAETIFLAAMYNHVCEKPTGNFDDQTLDSMFIHK